MQRWAALETVAWDRRPMWGMTASVAQMQSERAPVGDLPEKTQYISSRSQPLLQLRVDLGVSGQGQVTSSGTPSLSLAWLRLRRSREWQEKGTT